MITRNKMIQILAERIGIHADKPTITRYQKIGLIHPAQYINKRNNNKEARVYYNPLAVVEFATAALLFRGDWLSRKSKNRIGRCTDTEIRYGRALFYGRNSRLLPKELRKEWKEHLKLYTEVENTIPYHIRNMPESLIKARRRYLYEIYQTTFWKMYDILKEDIEEKETA